MSISVECQVPCRMRDGITLYSDHYYPSEGGPFPTLLIRQPYGKKIATTVVYAQPEWWARQGYHVCVQDSRGRGESEGTFYPFRTEAEDGVDTIAWLHTHPQCNGRIGMYGFSYQGLTQLLAAKHNPPGLQCLAPGMTMGDLYHGWFYQNGALRLSGAISWGLQMLRGDARKLGLRAESSVLETAAQRYAELFAFGPTQQLPALTQPALPTYFSDWIKHDRPGDFWAAQDISRDYAKLNIPALHVAGWHDMFGQGSLDLWRNLQTRGGPGAQGRQYLIAGPWVHIPWGQYVGDLDCGPAANLDTDLIHLRWFNHWLKDSGEFSAEPSARLFVLGRNEWINASTLPELGSAPSQTFYLHSGGRANSSKGDGVLSSEAPTGAESPDSYCYEPEVPVWAPGGGAFGGFRQNRSELFNNTLVYTSAPLEQSVLICGQPRLRLQARTTASDTDFTAKLVRVTADGTAWNLCLGIARASYLFRGNKFEANTVRLWEFFLDSTCCEFQPGDQLRLEIASSAYPLFDRNPNSGKRAAESDSFDWVHARQEVFHDSVHLSSLELPLLV